MTFSDYLDSTSDPEKVLLLRKQWDEVTETCCVTCPCGLLRHMSMAYRCLYCGVWFCYECARKHFGPNMVAQAKEKERQRAQTIS